MEIHPHGQRFFGVLGSSEVPPIWASAHSLPLQLLLVVLVPGILAFVSAGFALPQPR